MPGRRVFDLIEIPAELWQRTDVLEALRARDIGRLFVLLHRYTGVSQTRLAIACDTTQPKISGYMRGTAKVEELSVFERVADGLDIPDPARIALGLAPKADPTSPATAPAAPVIPPRNTRPVLPASAASGLLSADAGDSEEDDPSVRRRTFVSLTGAALFGAVLADPIRSGHADAIESFAAALASYAPDAAGSTLDEPPDLPSLAAAVARAKRDYQACRYSDVTEHLPALLGRLQVAYAVLDGEARSQAYTLSAEAHHVAASILFKVGDQGLGWLAADRSMQAARASEDPVTVASSARIVTHALMSGKHYKAATDTASTVAAKFDHDVTVHDPESLSVYGSLLLRGAIAAAQHDNRRGAGELLTEAEEAAARLGDDLNLRWTAFGPTNASLHRVNIAVTLGDAGTAIDVARTVDLGQIDVTERKATFLMDTARAFLQCGRHERAYLALRAAEEIAPEEITGRPAARRLVGDLMTTAPLSVQRQAEDFARRIGVAE
ncbi:MAG: XRE family transcriptional regulator [Streptosporangiaceae bacterium]